MKKKAFFFIIALIAVVPAVQAQSVLISLGKSVRSLVVCPFEVTYTLGRGIVHSSNGPGAVIAKAAINGISRIVGAAGNLVKEGWDKTPYFEDSKWAAKIKEPKPLYYADWISTGVGVGMAGVNSNWWGGKAYGWTRSKAAMIGAAAGATVGASLNNNDE